MTLAGIAVTGKVSVVASNTSQSVALPVTGSPTTVTVTNLGNEGPIFVVLSTSAAAVSTSEVGACILRNQALTLTRGANTFASIAGGPGPVEFVLGT